MNRDFPFRIKSLDDAGQFTGIASTYGNVDLLGDTIERGAYAKAIRDQGSGFPLLFGHDSTMPLGIAKVSDSNAGLLVDGKLVMSDSNAVRALAHMKVGSLKGLSIGYSVPEGKADFGRDGTRTLREIRLHEISLVAVPADPGAQVTSVKMAAEVLGKLTKEQLGAEDRAVLIAALRRLLGDKDATCQCDCEECLAGDCADCSNPDCEDPNCAANVDEEETLSALKQLARELRAA